MTFYMWSKDTIQRLMDEEFKSQYLKLKHWIKWKKIREPRKTSLKNIKINWFTVINKTIGERSSLTLRRTEISNTAVRIITKNVLKGDERYSSL